MAPCSRRSPGRTDAPSSSKRSLVVLAPSAPGPALGSAPLASRQTRHAWRKRVREPLRLMQWEGNDHTKLVAPDGRHAIDAEVHYKLNDVGLVRMGADERKRQAVVLAYGLELEKLEMEHPHSPRVLNQADLPGHLIELIGDKVAQQGVVRDAAPRPHLAAAERPLESDVDTRHRTIRGTANGGKRGHSKKEKAAARNIQND